MVFAVIPNRIQYCNHVWVISRQQYLELLTGNQQRVVYQGRTVLSDSHILSLRQLIYYGRPRNTIRRNIKGMTTSRVHSLSPKCFNVLDYPFASSWRTY